MSGSKRQWDETATLCPRCGGQQTIVCQDLHLHCPCELLTWALPECMYSGDPDRKAYRIYHLGLRDGIDFNHPTRQSA